MPSAFSSNARSAHEEESALLRSRLSAQGQLRTKPKSRSWAWFILPWVIALLSAVALVVTSKSSTRGKCVAHEIFSPVKQLLGSKEVVFGSGLKEKHALSPYQGPSSPERDRLWLELYDVGVTAIPSSMAHRLENRTIENPMEPGQHLTTLAVFPALRCVDVLRKRLWMQSDPLAFWTASDEGDIGNEVAALCIERLRQTVMCNADVTPIPHKWVRVQADAYFEIQHSCHDFEAVKDWAARHQAKGLVLGDLGTSESSHL